MNYNHPLHFYRAKGSDSDPYHATGDGIVTEVTDKNNQLIQKGEVLLSSTRFVTRRELTGLQADLMTATHNIKTLRAQLTEARANTTPGFSGARPSV